MSPLHLILTAHTTRHLRRTLLGVAVQSRRADSVWVSCDNDEAAIAQCLREVCNETGLDVWLVQRPFRGQARCGQVRNNAVRALLDTKPPCFDAAAAPDRLVFLDQDCCPAIDFLEQHERHARFGKNSVVLGYRIDLTQAQTDALDDDTIRAGQLPAMMTSPQHAALDRRHRRIARQALWRRIGFSKSHKPKILGANFGVSLAAYCAVNGFDDLYEGWGQEDDDFVRRLYLNGGVPSVAVRDTLAFHQWHATRAPDDWKSGPNAVMFSDRRGRALHPRCLWGLDSPRDQDEPTLVRLLPGQHENATAGNAEMVSEQACQRG